MDTKEILDNHKAFSHNGCSLAFALSDIQRKANCIRKMSDERIAEGEEVAKMHCENISQWMHEMEEVVQNALTQAIKKYNK
jgi:hypothetical protein